MRPQRIKRTVPTTRGRGVTAASLAFNQVGGGSNPSDLIEESRAESPEPENANVNVFRLSTLGPRLSTRTGSRC
jgi:hypothetical protein